MSKTKGKRFRTALFGGFKKKDVISYLDNLIKGYDDTITTKDENIRELIEKNKELGTQLQLINDKYQELESMRDKITGALMHAQEQASNIIETAIKEAEMEKSKVSDIIKREFEKLIEIKDDLRLLNTDVFNALKTCEAKVQDYLGGK